MIAESVSAIKVTETRAQDGWRRRAKQKANKKSMQLLTAFPLFFSFILFSQLIVLCIAHETQSDLKKENKTS